MAPPRIPLNEEDIWKYKCTATRRESIGKRQCSTKLTSKGGKKKETVSAQDSEVMVIDVDLEEDFSFTHLKPICNEQSSKQWAHMFSKSDDVKVDLSRSKNNNKEKKRSFSKSNLRNSNKQKVGRKSSLVNDKNGNETCKDFISSFSPQKGSPKKQKGSDSAVCSSSLSAEGEDLRELSACDNKNEPRVVDVIVIGEENDDDVPRIFNETYSIDTVSGSDLMDLDLDQDSAGGFLKNEDDWGNETDSQHSMLQSFTNKSSTKTSPGTMCDESKIPSPSLPSTSNDCLKFDVSNHSDVVTSVPLPPAAQKQTSLFSFFASKSIISHDKTNPSQRSKSRPYLAKSVSDPPNKRAAKRQPMPSESASVSENVPASDNLENKSFRGRQRQCPFYKKIPDTNITVDAFRYGVIPGCNVYFLTHFHYDHYGGLTKKFTQPIYCSEVTGNLVERRLGVAKQFIHRLPLWKPVQVDGVTLTLMEANHCPGAVIILFETVNGKKILHTGDFRASLEMEDYPALKNVVVDELYLDTTYCNPSYAFPSQKSVIDFTVSLVEKQMMLNPKTLIVCGAYTIGKERIFAAIAAKLDTKICVMSDKKKVLDCLDNDDLKKRLTLDWSEGQVHVLPMAKLKQQALFDHHLRHSRFTSILAFEPTGWTHSDRSISLENLKPKWSRNGVTVYGVPYSEHSSYLEMRRFVQFIRPKKILPTVNNGNPAARKKMEDIFKLWLTEESPGVCDKDGATSSKQSKMDDWMVT